jgi:hypothetical protein
MAKKRAREEGPTVEVSGEVKKGEKAQGKAPRKKGRTGEAGSRPTTPQRKGPPVTIATPPPSNPETPTPTKKNKKPKHLKRKLEQALVEQDAGVIQEITLLQQELEASKLEKARKWKETCQQLAGPAWDETKFDELIGVGMDKKKLLEALGIESSDEKKKRLREEKKSLKLKEKKSFPQQRKGRGKPQGPGGKGTSKGTKTRGPGTPRKTS